MLQTIEVNPKVPPNASVIWMHGLGADGSDFVNFLPLLQLPKELPIRFIFPHAPVRAIDYFGCEKVRGWFNVTTIDRRAKEDSVGIKESQKLIGELIAEEIAAGITSDKVILAGFSQGGVMALHCGLRYPEKLGGILSLSAWLPLVSSITTERTEVNQHTPILMMHGTYDTLIPIAWAEDSCSYLKDIGYDVTLTSYTMQHEVCSEQARAIGAWLTNVLSK